MERIAPFFLRHWEQDRGDDVTTFQAAKDSLWAVDQDVSQFLNRVEEFDEIGSEEEEEGAAAYAEDAVVALYYALKQVVEPDGQWGTYCAQRTFDSAYFLDEANGGTSAHHEEEQARQRRDLARLAADLPVQEAVAELRAESATTGLSRYSSME